MTRTSLDAWKRLRDTRARIDRLVWAARSEVIRAQLMQMRGTRP